MEQFSAVKHGKLGKLPATSDPRDIRFSLLKEKPGAGQLPPKIPARFGHGSAFTDWEMLGNGPDNTVESGFGGAGDCVFAQIGHTIMEAAKVRRRPVPRITGKEAIAAYSEVTGYVINDDSTDQGTDMRQAMGWWRSNGFKDADGKVHKIGAYVSIDPKDWDQLMEATWVFGFVAIGFEFPNTAMQQFDEGLPWDVVPNAQIEGGHCVPVYGRSALSTAGPVSWARRVGMTRAFYESYNDESWAAIFEDELVNGKTERGWDLTALSDELKKLGIS